MVTKKKNTDYTYLSSKTTVHKLFIKDFFRFHSWFPLSTIRDEKEKQWFRFTLTIVYAWEGKNPQGLLHGYENVQLEGHWSLSAYSGRLFW